MSKLGKGPNFDYKYGIYAKIGRRGWGVEQIQYYFDSKGYPYEKSMGVEELIEELKKWEK